MRLGQLARKLALRPVEILDFLAQQQIQIEDGSNTKMEDDHVALVLQKFSPSRAEELMSALDEQDETFVNFTPSPAANTANPSDPATEQDSGEVKNSSQEGDDQKIELIKAQKVELSGLKVLGKIDLPEPKKKDPTPAPDESQEGNPPEPPQKPRQEIRKSYPQRGERPYQPAAKNPIALQREREAREVEKRRQEELERQKEKRTQHYHKRVKPAPPTKRIRLVEEEVEELSEAEMAEGPKTWWGKFIKWLNT